MLKASVIYGSALNHETKLSLIKKLGSQHLLVTTSNSPQNQISPRQPDTKFIRREVENEEVEFEMQLLQKAPKKKETASRE